MNWEFHLPVKIVFGLHRAKDPAVFAAPGSILVCDSFLVERGREMMAASKGAIVGVFSDFSPNPDVTEVDACCAAIRKAGAQAVVAMGGGSAIDAAKAASVISFGDKPARAYHSEGAALPDRALPLTVIPTTAGTGSEVTCVAVLSDKAKGLKAPLASPLFYAKQAVIDPELTLTVPPRITASTGLDALAHAIEGYWSLNHQPICDALAMHAAKLVFENLYAVYRKPADAELREKLCEASVIAGVAFSHPKTTGSHACSFPLTGVYHMPHGEACAFTLDYFIRLNDSLRVSVLAKHCGFAGAGEMADAVYGLKKGMAMPLTLSDAGIPEGDIATLANASMHPNMKNNPVAMDVDAVAAMYTSLA